MNFYLCRDNITSYYEIHQEKPSVNFFDDNGELKFYFRSSLPNEEVTHIVPAWPLLFPSIILNAGEIKIIEVIPNADGSYLVRLKERINNDCPDSNPI